MADKNQTTAFELDSEMEALSLDDLNANTHWTAMPQFLPKEKPIKLVISVEEESQLDQLIHKLGLIAKRGERTASAWWPPREREDPKSLRFDFKAVAKLITFLKVTTPHWVAGIEAHDSYISVTAPVLNYMMGWDSAKFVEYCNQREWQWEVVNEPVPYEPEIQ